MAALLEGVTVSLFFCSGVRKYLGRQGCRRPVSPTAAEAVKARMRCLTCLLPDDLARALVFSETVKHRLAQSIIARPLCEFDLADHFRPHPMAPFHVGSSRVVGNRPDRLMQAANLTV
jgi:hypothetical protein